MQFIAIASLGLAAVVSAQNFTEACNPAHSYPEGVQCVSTNGGLALVTPSVSVDTPLPEATESASTTGYACNPAHSYPEGVQCVSTNGALALVTPSVSVDTPLPEATESASTTGYACNPAHSYPEGVQCVSTNGALALVTPSANATGAVYVTEVVTALTTYCPAATEIVTNGKTYTVSSATTLTITDCPCTVTKSTSVPVATGSITTGYACNPAHSYPNGASCVSTSGGLTLVTPSASGYHNGTATASTPVAYTGAAAHFGAGSGLVAAVAGAVILL